MYYFFKSLKHYEHLAITAKKEKCHRRFWSLHDLIRNAVSTFVLAKTKTSMPELTLDTALNILTKSGNVFLQYLATWNT